MAKYCPECGQSLVESRVVPKYWTRILRCPSAGCGSYLEMTDMRWGEYGLQRLQMGVPEKVDSATEDQLELALSRVSAIDYRTISIVGFEHTMLSFQDQRRL
jgi:hypothetical protein